jgi:mannose-6-phosphate isomerase-like protein (cupin superfamily)
MITIKKSTDNSIITEKGWGVEIELHNNLYCGKILRFKKNGMFSMHFHGEKTETWYVNKGEFVLVYVDTKLADKHSVKLSVGDIIDVDKYQPHQLIAVTEGEIFEVSTEHHDYDNYRIEKGDSQT